MPKRCQECGEGEIVDGYCNACGAPDISVNAEDTSTSTVMRRCPCGGEVNEDGICMDCGEFVEQTQVEKESPEDEAAALTKELEKAAEEEATEELGPG